MKNLNIFIIIFLFFSLSNVNAGELDKRNKITKNLRCLICQGQSVYDSDSEFANSLKIVVDEKSKRVYQKNRYMIILRKNMVIGFCMIPVLTKIHIFYGYCLY